MKKCRQAFIFVHNVAKGFKIGDRLLRASQVGVSSNNDVGSLSMKDLAEETHNDMNVDEPTGEQDQTDP